MYMRPTPNGFRDRIISLYSSKIVDKKKILCIVSNADIYCSSDKGGTVYLLNFFKISPTISMQFSIRVRTRCVSRL
jgi:hypothetical protein